MKLKQILISLLISLILVSLVGATLFYIAGKQATRVTQSGKMQNTLTDGEYLGSFYAFKKVPAAKVQFTISNSTLSNFYIIDVLTIPKYDLKTKIHQSVANEGLDFDAISGATISSAFVKAAIVNAIETKE